MIRPGLARNAKILPRNLGKSFSMVSWRTSYILFFPLERGKDGYSMCKAPVAHTSMVPKLPLTTAFPREPELCFKNIKKVEPMRSRHSGLEQALTGAGCTVLTSFLPSVPRKLSNYTVLWFDTFLQQENSRFPHVFSFPLGIGSCYVAWSIPDLLGISDVSTSASEWLAP